jgi:hypothetical protein
VARRPECRRRAQSPAVTGRVPVIVPGDQVQALVAREDRMARFVAGSRFVRLLAIGGLVAVGWLLGVVVGVVVAGPAAAEARVPARQVTAAQPGDVTTHGRAVISEDAVTHGDSASAAGVPTSHAVGRTGRRGSPLSGDLRGASSKRGDGFATSHVATGPAFAGGFPTVRVDVPADAGAMAGRTVDGLTSQSKPLSPQPSTADHSAGANGFVPRPGSGPFGPGFGDVARSVFDPRLAVAPAEMASVPAPVVRAAVDDPSFSPD